VNSNYRDTASVDALRATTLYVVLTLIFGLWLAWDAAFLRMVTFSPLSDYWEYTALFSEWQGNFAAPSNPYVDDPSLSALYMPWFWALTFFGLVFEFDAIQLMSISAVLNYFLIVIGLHVFLKNYFRDPWAPLIGYIAIFMCWGLSSSWTNLYHLRSFFYVGGFPSTFVFGLSLLSFALVLRLLRRDGSVFVMSVILCMLSALMFLCHPLTGIFGIVGCALLALTDSSESIGLRALTLLMLAAGTLLAEFWPYFSVWRVVLGLYGTGAEQGFLSSGLLHSDEWRHIFYNPRLVLTILGPALLGLPLCIWLYMRREHMFIVLGAICMAIPYLLHPFVEVPLAYQFLLFVVTYFHFAIVWGVLQVIDAWNLRPRPAYAGTLLWGVVSAIAILLVANIILVTMEFRGYTLSPESLQLTDSRAELPGGMSVVNLYSRLTDPLPEEAVVLATPAVGWPLPTIKGKVVSLYHANPMLVDQYERFIATSNFFELPQEPDVRTALIKRYGTTHLLLKGEPSTAELNDWLTAHVRLLASIGDYRMYRLLASSTDAVPPPPPVQVDEQETVDVIVVPDRIAQPVNPVLVSKPVDTPRLVAPAPSPKTENKISTPPRSSRRTHAKRDDLSASTYGAPIAEPLIAPTEEMLPYTTRPDTGVGSEEDTTSVSVVTVPADSMPSDSRPSAKETDTGAEVYGVPIPEPVLDPERHGG